VDTSKTAGEGGGDGSGGGADKANAMEKMVSRGLNFELISNQELGGAWARARTKRGDSVNLWLGPKISPQSGQCVWELCGSRNTGGGGAGGY